MASKVDHQRQVGVIGLGLLGTALCERLLGAGYTVVVWNRTRDKAEPLIARGARWSDNPLAECDRVVICLYTTEIVEEVLDQMEAGPAARADPHRHDDRRSGANDRARQRLAKLGVDYLESPIAASSEQTRQGQAMAIVAGPSRRLRRLPRPLRRHRRQDVSRRDRWGSRRQGEAREQPGARPQSRRAGRGAGLRQSDRPRPGKTLDVLKEGNSYSGVMDTKGRKMIEGDFSLQAKLSQHAKDVRIILEEAAAAAFRCPFPSCTCGCWREAEAAGLRRARQQRDYSGDRERRAAENKGRLTAAESVVGLPRFVDTGTQ